jgi:hypothetical protein
MHWLAHFLLVLVPSLLSAIAENVKKMKILLDKGYFSL